MKELVALGISASRAAIAAFEFSHCKNPGRAPGEPFPLGRTFLVGTREGARVINVAPDQTLDENITGASFVIDCGKIYRNVISKLETKH